MNYFMIPNIGSMAIPWVHDHPYWMVLPWQLQDPRGLARTQTRFRLACRHTILDNGAYESRPVSNEQLANLANESEIQTVVCPDQIRATAIQSRSAQLGFYTCDRFHHPLTRRFMYCLAGMSQNEVLDDAHWAFDQLDPHKWIIGIGAAYYNWCANPSDRQSELPRLRMLTKIIPIADRCHSTHYMHVLGARWNGIRAYSEIENTSGHSWSLVGIDTQKPFACALGGTVYPEKPEVRCGHIVHSRPSTKLLKANILAFCDSYGLEVPHGVS